MTVSETADDRAARSVRIATRAETIFFAECYAGNSASGNQRIAANSPGARRERLDRSLAALL